MDQPSKELRAPAQEVRLAKDSSIGSLERQRCVSADMKIQSILALACGGIALVVIAVLAASAYWENEQRPFVNGPKLMSAVRAFSRDQVARGLPLAAEISLQDLIRGGYVTTNDVRGFEGMELAFFPQADDTNAQQVLARARMSDGDFICLLSDGSVQQISRQKYEQTHGPAGQSAGGTNRSQGTPSRLF
ncbi:MAG TPA: hypothetical protein VL361_27255 [Candidatus Limnocylindrales bacterium]|jgi:hypothetical protein|nr:hypothetical protein [Candidatus Limnocylindrales bacterium]